MSRYFRAFARLCGALLVATSLPWSLTAAQARPRRGFEDIIVELPPLKPIRDTASPEVEPSEPKPTAEAAPSTPLSRPAEAFPPFEKNLLGSHAIDGAPRLNGSILGGAPGGRDAPAANAAAAEGQGKEARAPVAPQDSGAPAALPQAEARGPASPAPPQKGGASEGAAEGAPRSAAPAEATPPQKAPAAEPRSADEGAAKPATKSEAAAAAPVGVKSPPDAAPARNDAPDAEAGRAPPQPEANAESAAAPEATGAGEGLRGAVAPSDPSGAPPAGEAAAPAAQPEESLADLILSILADVVEIVLAIALGLGYVIYTRRKDAAAAREGDASPEPQASAWARLVAKVRARSAGAAEPQPTSDAPEAASQPKVSAGKFAALMDALRRAAKVRKADGSAPVASKNAAESAPKVSLLARLRARISRKPAATTSAGAARAVVTAPAAVPPETRAYDPAAPDLGLIEPGAPAAIVANMRKRLNAGANDQRQT